MWRQRTKTGRVVYERKKKEFTCGDVRRIAQKVLAARAGTGFSVFERREVLYCLLPVFVDLILEIEKLWEANFMDETEFSRYLDPLQKRKKGTKFGDGEFGGGGATRDY